MSLVSFGSDNHAGVHPLLMEEMLQVNQGFAPSYEQDLWSQKLKKQILEQFDAIDCALVFNGTAANVICLQLGLKSYESVLCSEHSHLTLDECGAPEKIAGVKLIDIPSNKGKITPDLLEKKLIRRGDQHFSQVKMVSVTQPTEYGTLYSLEELQDIVTFAKKNNLYLHMDGARLANAAVALDCDFKTLTQGFDLVSFGGAKKGLMLGEAVIVKNENLKEGLKFYRKQSLQLPSKTRFLAAPFLRYLENQLYAEIAHHENQMAQSLRQELESISGLEITTPTQANSVFCILPKNTIKQVRKKFFFYVWDEAQFEVRLMTSFATQPEHIDGLVQEIKKFF